MNQRPTQGEFQREFDLASTILCIANECHETGRPDRAVALAAVVATLFPVMFNAEDQVFADLLTARAQMGVEAFNAAVSPFEPINSLKALAHTDHEPTPAEVLRPLLLEMIEAYFWLDAGRGALQFYVTRLIERETAAGLSEYVAYYLCLLAYLKEEAWEELAAALTEPFRADWQCFHAAVTAMNNGKYYRDWLEDYEADRRGDSSVE